MAETTIVVHGRRVNINVLSKFLKVFFHQGVINWDRDICLHMILNKTHND